MVNQTEQEAYWPGTPEQDTAIRQELYRALVLLDAGSGLLGIVNSWKNTMPAGITLAHLRDWNWETALRSRDRIGHFESVFAVDRSQVADGQTLLQESQATLSN
jgi:hypothetical protein